jgi:hypothetical protein
MIKFLKIPMNIIKKVIFFLQPEKGGNLWTLKNN